MVFANTLKDDQTKDDKMLSRVELSKLSKEELITEVIKVCECKKAQEDFILNISHDLRSPLNVILSVLQCYKEDYVNKDKKACEHIDIIKRNGYKILKLIDNLIDTTKLERKHYELKMENLDIINLIEWNISSMDKYAKQKDIALIFDTNVEECVMAVDSEAIDRIIMNLISNAIKFSPQGSNIYINAWKNKNQLTVSVKDEGVGIPKDEQSNIFDRFIQSSKNKKNEHSGSGIGLDLVRYLTEAHQGKIELKSEENKGSEFIVRLPMKVLSEEVNKKNRCLKTKNQVELLEIEFSDIYL